MDKSSVRVANAEMIREAAMQAEARNYNRQISDSVLQNLDEDGTNMGWVLMTHEHAMGKKVTPHYRCRLLLKVNGRTEPVEAFMDMPMDTFDAWPTVDRLETWEAQSGASDGVTSHDYGSGKPASMDPRHAA